MKNRSTNGEKMFNFKNLDWSYNSLRRYVLDIHIFLVVILIFSYIIEPYNIQENYTLMIIIIWLLSIAVILIMRLLNFTTSEALKSDKSTTITIKIEINKENEKLFTQDDENYKELQKYFSEKVKDYVTQKEKRV